MKAVTLLHNPRCSKSRQALHLLNEKGVSVTVVEYLKAPLSYEQLKDLSQQFDFNEFVRKNEAAFKARALSMDDKDAVLKAMAEEPKLMQRPIALCDGKALIARPPEKLGAWLGI